MMQKNTETTRRKADHLEIVCTNNVRSKLTTGFEDVYLVPRTLSEVSYDSIDISSEFLGRTLRAPLMISSMTGGTEEAGVINRTLALAAQHYGLAISLGSQKAMIEHPELARTYQIRRYAPDALIIGNIGIDYLVSSDFSINKLSHALKVAGVDAVYIHLNMVQELAQVEGCRDFTAAYSKIALMCEKIGVPVIAKEVGHGMDPITSKKLEDCGVAAIDIAGLGGTSWAYVESYRGSEIGETFRDWGIPTCLSLMLLADRTSLPVISSGGIENGIDITKSLVLGAKLAGIARLFLAKAVDGEDALSKQIENIISEIRCTMALIGVSSIADIHEVPYVVTGKTREMIDLLAKKY